ncbi:MAG TPA: hypothetical protein VFX21_05275 [Acidimicrobiia bacterium]|nr:hypothetical protein [Acidimicrobiia bacterium]
MLSRHALRTNEAHLWWLRVREEPTAAIESVLDDGDRRALAGAADTEWRTLVVWRRALLRLVAGALVDVDPATVPLGRRCPTCGATDHGAPTIADCDVSLSAAAADGIVVVAACAGLRVGVDVLARADGEAALFGARIVCTSADVDALDAIPDEHRGDAALHAVTQLDAYAKLGGLHHHAYPEISVSIDVFRSAVRAGDAAFWARRVDPGPGYVANLVADGRPRAVRGHDATDLLIDVMHGSSAA